MCTLRTIVPTKAANVRLCRKPVHGWLAACLSVKSFDDVYPISLWPLFRVLVLFLLFLLPYDSRIHWSSNQVLIYEPITPFFPFVLYNDVYLWMYENRSFLWEKILSVQRLRCPVCNECAEKFHRFLYLLLIIWKSLKGRIITCQKNRL